MSDTPRTDAVAFKLTMLEGQSDTIEREMVSADEMRKLERQLTAAEKVISDIHQWCDAYPVDVFPEPDFELVRIALESRGLTVADDESEDDAVDAVSASNMRHVLNGVREIIDAATGKAKEGE